MLAFVTILGNPSVISAPSLQVSASFLRFWTLEGYRVGITGIKALGGHMLGQISGRSWEGTR